MMLLLGLTIYMAKTDLARLKHMLEAGQVCLEFTKNKKRKDFENARSFAH